MITTVMLESDCEGTWITQSVFDPDDGSMETIKVPYTRRERLWLIAGLVRSLLRR